MQSPILKRVWNTKYQVKVLAAEFIADIQYLQRTTSKSIRTAPQEGSAQ